MVTTRRQQRIAAQLQQIAEANNGRLTPEQVVADATDEASPLHTEFEWSDDVAAHKFRVAQARQLIRQVRVIARIDNVSVPVVAYLRDPAAARDAQGYVSTITLRTEADLAREAVQYEIERAMATLARAREVARALGLAEEIEGMRETLIALRTRLSVAA